MPKHHEKRRGAWNHREVQVHLSSRILIKLMLLCRFSKKSEKMLAPLESLYKIRATERSTIKC